MPKSALKNDNASSSLCKSRRTYCYNIALSEDDADMVKTAGKEHHYLTFEWVNDDGLTEIYRLRCSLGLASNPQARRNARPSKFKRKNTNTLDLEPDNTRLSFSIRLTRHNVGSLGGLWWRNSDEYFIELLPSREGRKQRSSLPWPLTVFELKTNHRIRVLRFERGNKVRVNFLIQKEYTKENGNDQVEDLKQKRSGTVQDMQCDEVDISMGDLGTMEDDVNMQLEESPRGYNMAEVYRTENSHDAMLNLRQHDLYYDQGRISNSGSTSMCTEIPVFDETKSTNDNSIDTASSIFSDYSRNDHDFCSPFHAHEFATPESSCISTIPSVDGGTGQKVDLVVMNMKVLVSKDRGLGLLQNIKKTLAEKFSAQNVNCVKIDSPYSPGRSKCWKLVIRFGDLDFSSPDHRRLAKQRMQTVFRGAKIPDSNVVEENVEPGSIIVTTWIRKLDTQRRFLIKKLTQNYPDTTCSLGVSQHPLSDAKGSLYTIRASLPASECKLARWRSHIQQSHFCSELSFMLNVAVQSCEFEGTMSSSNFIEQHKKKFHHMSNYGKKPSTASLMENQSQVEYNYHRSQLAGSDKSFFDHLHTAKQLGIFVLMRWNRYFHRRRGPSDLPPPHLGDN